MRVADIAKIADRRRDVMIAAAGRWQGQSGVRRASSAAVASDGPGAADTVARQSRFAAREGAFVKAAELRAVGRLPIFIERKIGSTLDFLSSAPNEAARRAGRPVARIVTTVDPNRVAEGFATGFLVTPTLLMTNWHVFPNAGSARGTGANFLHDFDGEGVEIGVTFKIIPDRFFVADERLDFAVVAIDPTPVAGTGVTSASDLGIIGLSGATSKILVGQGIDLVEYPDGGAKKFVTQNNRLLGILDEGFLHYESDTLEGSSGSPAFSEQWELVGVHHAGIPEVRDGKIIDIHGGVWTDGMPDDQIHWIANEGVRISAIVTALAAIEPVDLRQAVILKDLLAGTADPADEITRLITAESIAGAAPGIDLAAISKGASAMGVTMNFSGPVTINVYGQQDAVTATASTDTTLAVEKSLRFDPDYDDRAGYDLQFLGEGLVVPPPTVAAARDGEMYKVDGQTLVLKYHHYSLAMNRARRLQMWSAVNVDYDSEMRTVSGRANFGTDRWIVDPRIPASLQIADPDFYQPAGQIDRGHIVRREDSAWGETPLATEFANSDTFHWTNCTPQHAAFNRESPPAKQYGATKGLWGGFEGYVQNQLKAGDTKACILAGPMLLDRDPSANFGTGLIQYPIAFWKVVVIAAGDTDGGRSLHAFGFVLSQSDVVDRFGIEFAVGEYGRYQRPLADIAAQAGISFDQALIDADQFDAKPA